MDINNVFDQILLSEERISEEGYKQGFKKGVTEGNLEAYHLGKHCRHNLTTTKTSEIQKLYFILPGFHRGAEIGAELGFYLGVLENSKIPSPINEKVAHLITQLKSIISSFPRVNCETVDLFESLNTIRTQFKKLTSLLKIKVTYPEKSQLTF